MTKPPPPVSERPTCPNCDKPLRPNITIVHGMKTVPRTAYRRTETENPGVTRMTQVPTGETDVVPDFSVTRREWAGTFAGYGAFCTLRCCAEFANAAFGAGYRGPNSLEA